MKIWKHSVERLWLWCAIKLSWDFPEMLGHVTRPGDLTWPDMVLKFLHNVRKGCRNRCAKNGGAARRRFSAISKKPEEGCLSTPPARRGLTRALMGLWIFHHLMGGGLRTPPPSNSAPRKRRDKRKIAFESSSKIITKLLQSIFCWGQTWGHQRSSKVKIPEIGVSFG